MKELKNINNGMISVILAECEGVTNKSLVTFDNCTWHPDEQGNLDILRGSDSFLVATFACGEWRYVTYQERA